MRFIKQLIKIKKNKIYNLFKWKSVNFYITICDHLNNFLVYLSLILLFDEVTDL